MFQNAYNLNSSFRGRDHNL